mgnify:CR=1 FL=1
MKQIWKQTWRQRLAAALIQLLMVLAMAGVGIRMPVQAAEKNAVTQSGEMKVHFLDVGQGLSILAQSEGKTMIYDGGDRKTSRFVVSYLKEHGVSKLITDQQPLRCRSYGRLIGCLNAFDVKKCHIQQLCAYEQAVSVICESSQIRWT